VQDEAYTAESGFLTLNGEFCAMNQFAIIADGQEINPGRQLANIQGVLRVRSTKVCLNPAPARARFHLACTIAWVLPIYIRAKPCQ